MHEALEEPHKGKRLLATCTNLSCARQFHVTAHNQQQADFFKALFAGSNEYGPVRLVLVCPHCGVHLQVLASMLGVCTCGQEAHAEWPAKRADGAA